MAPMEESSSWMVEQAKEELQILEAQHPNRYGFLKMELRSFISGETNASSPFFHNSVVFYGKDTITPIPADSSATTQASSNRKKRKASMNRKLDQDNPQLTKTKFSKLNHSMEMLDAAIGRAEECLRKFQEFKRSFTHY